MGVNLDSSNYASKYHKQLVLIFHYICERVCNYQYHFDFIYKLSSLRANINRCIRPLHLFATNVINQRRIIFHELYKKSFTNETDIYMDDM